MSFPNYVLDADLTIEYIQTLIDRNGFINVSDQYPLQALVIIQDLNGIQTWFNDYPHARDYCVQQYLIMMNS